MEHKKAGSSSMDHKKPGSSSVKHKKAGTSRMLIKTWLKKCGP
jgi:hypothetical protein